MHSLFTFLMLREPYNIILQQQKLTWVSFSDFILSDSASTSHWNFYELLAEEVIYPNYI